jgi:hypothetical protein
MLRLAALPAADPIQACKPYSDRATGIQGGHMFRKITVIGQTMLTVLLGSALIGQSAPPPPSSPAVVEFPVVMRERIDAGKTPVGTKVQAQLVLATMVGGVVVPRDAIFSGEVVESAAKSANAPSRLSIRMDSAQWKNGSAPVKVYLTSWFYPVAAMTSQDLSYEPRDSANSARHWNGAGTYPDPNNPVSQQKFPGRDTDDNTSQGSASPSSNISKHRVLIKNVESTRSSDGALTLTSKRSNIKLDKMTTYVLSSGDLLPRD